MPAAETGKGIITCRGRCSNMVESPPMPTERFNFPKTFLWGTATAAHQVEDGNVNNDYWVLEHTPGSPFFEPSGDACDQYHRYPEDIGCSRGSASTRTAFRLNGPALNPSQAS